jgi:hypothetical protein
MRSLRRQCIYTIAKVPYLERVHWSTEQGTDLAVRTLHCPTSASSEYCIVLPTTFLGAFPCFVNPLVAVLAGERGEIEIVYPI